MELLYKPKIPDTFLLSLLFFFLISDHAGPCLSPDPCVWDCFCHRQDQLPLCSPVVSHLVQHLCQAQLIHWDPFPALNRPWMYPESPLTLFLCLFFPLEP